MKYQFINSTPFLINYENIYHIFYKLFNDDNEISCYYCDLFHKLIDDDEIIFRLEESWRQSLYNVHVKCSLSLMYKLPKCNICHTNWSYIDTIKTYQYTGRDIKILAKMNNEKTSYAILKRPKILSLFDRIFIGYQFKDWNNSFEWTQKIRI